MYLHLIDTATCAVQEISGLSYYGSLNTKSAMKDFCALVLHQPVKYRSVKSKDQQIYSFYMFTAGVYDSKDRSSCYGYAFAKFIEDNGLGEVFASPVKTNKAFHAEHSNQVWLWCPDLSALKAWYAENTREEGGQN